MTSVWKFFSAGARMMRAPVFQYNIVSVIGVVNEFNGKRDREFSSKVRIGISSSF